MVYEFIGRIVVYVIGTLIFGAFFGAIDDDNDIFCGAWLASIVVFLCLIMPPTQ